MEFQSTFEHLTGSPPLPWQTAMYERFVSDRADNIPSSCGLPTGLDKTSVAAIWLIALSNHPERLPRRFVYVFNRRNAVDQTANEIEIMRDRIATSADLHRLRSKFAELCSVPLEDDEPPISITTLRDEYAGGNEWRINSSRPAVIVGTVAGVAGSLPSPRYSGERARSRGFSIRFGLLDHEALLIHDEPHLEPAFQNILATIEAQQFRDGDRRPRVMELITATRAASNDGEPFGPAQMWHDAPRREGDCAFNDGEATHYWEGEAPTEPLVRCVHLLRGPLSNSTPRVNRSVDWLDRQTAGRMGCAHHWHKRQIVPGE